MDKKILTDDELDELIVQFNSERTPPTRNPLRAVEQVVMSKLSNQKPYLWASSQIEGHYVLDEIRSSSAEWFREKLDTPLYLHPTKIHDDWQLVPKEPIRTMVDQMQRQEEAGFYAMYYAALASAPKYEEPK